MRPAVLGGGDLFLYFVCQLYIFVFFCCHWNQSGLLGCVVRMLNWNEAVIVVHNLIGINRQ